jgi:hypothetical protein
LVSNFFRAVTLSSINYLALQVAAGWRALGVWLGRKQRALADAQAKRDQTASVRRHRCARSGVILDIMVMGGRA